MKYLFCLISLFILPYSMVGQEKFERFTINLGFTHAVYKDSNPVEKFTIVPEVEFLVNLPLGKTTKLSTGIGIESGKHMVTKEEAHLSYVEPFGWIPWRGTYHWNLDFLSIKVPVYFSVPFNNSILDAVTFGSGLGWLMSYELTEEQMPNTSHIKINRSFLDVSLGVQKKLFQFNEVSLSITPQIGYRTYLTDYNNWQKKCFLGELKFNIGF